MARLTSSLQVALKSLGVVTHIANIGIAILTGVQFIARGDLWWGIATLVTVVLSMAITTILLCLQPFNSLNKVLFIICFPLVPLGSHLWDLKLTWQDYRSGSDASSDIDAPAPTPTEDFCRDSLSANAYWSEVYSEALPQACFGIHIVFQTLYAPDVEGTVEWYQWLSLGLSIFSLSLYYTIVQEYERKWKMPLFSLGIFYVIISRLIISATLAVLHPAMFFLPIVTEIVIIAVTMCLCNCKSCDDAETTYGMAVFSTINIWFGIGCLYITAVPQAITLTTLVIILIANPIQIWTIRRAL